MKTYRVILTHTVLITKGTRSSFTAMRSNIMELTFEEILFTHRTNYKKSGTVHTNYCYLSTNGYSSERFDSFRVMEQQLEEEAVYELSLDYAWLRLTLLDKTKEELDNLASGVSSMSLD